MKHNKGQELVEFVIIISLIVISAIIALTILGANVKDLFGLSHNKYKEFKPFENSAGSNSSSQNGSQTNNNVPSGPPASTTNVNGIPVNIYNDGSIAFSSNGQQVYLDKSTINQINTAMETVGSTGGEKIIAMIDEMISEHKSEYPNSDVPLEMYFGQGNRTAKGEEQFYGNASMNLVMVQVGKDFKILQKDQAGKTAGEEFKIQGNSQNTHANINDKNSSYPDGLQNLNTVQSGDKLYVMGSTEKDGSAGGSGIKPENWAPTGMTIPEEWKSLPHDDKDPPPGCYIKYDSKENHYSIKDNVWLLQFDTNSKKSL